MERRVPIEWRLAALAVAAVFLLTSCPAPLVESRSTPDPAAPVADRGKIKCCYIDHGGEFTDDVDGAYGKLYWVERDGRTQPGLVSVGRKDNMINVVNFVDTDSGNRFRLFFMDQTNLPHQMVVECKDDSGNWRTLVGETRPVSLEFGQSSSSFLAHTAALLKDFSTKEKIFDPNTQSSLSPVPDRFYLSIKRKTDRGTSDYTSVYTFVVFNPKSDSMVTLVNGVGGLSTRLENKNHVLTDEAKYKNIFKVNICTDELHCPDRN